MKEQEAVRLLKKLGYVIEQPADKPAMLELLEDMFEWYDDVGTSTAKDKATYYTIKHLIEEHA